MTLAESSLQLYPPDFCSALVPKGAEVYFLLSLHASVTAFCYPQQAPRQLFSLGKIHISEHLLSLASNYIHVICAQHWLHNTQRCPCDFLCMLV